VTSDRYYVGLRIAEMAGVSAGTLKELREFASGSPSRDKQWVRIAAQPVSGTGRTLGELWGELMQDLGLPGNGGPRTLQEIDLLIWRAGRRFLEGAVPTP
jgi:hypothetical protein